MGSEEVNHGGPRVPLCSTRPGNEDNLHPVTYDFVLVVLVSPYGPPERLNSRVLHLLEHPVSREPPVGGDSMESRWRTVEDGWSGTRGPRQHFVVLLGPETRGPFRPTTSGRSTRVTRSRKSSDSESKEFTGPLPYGRRVLKIPNSRY